MKFTVEIEEFWLDEEDLSEALVSHISSSVTNDIEQSIKKKVEDQITRVVKNTVEKSLYRKVESEVSSIIENGMVKGQYSNDPDVTLETYIKNEFMQNTGYRSADSRIKELAKKFADGMKSRYDLIYASQIVSTLNENGLLKSDVAKLLLEKNKDE